jgi:hypothetical protein
MTLQSDVGLDNDNAFLSTYHSVDDNYNNMVQSNEKLNFMYNIEFSFNDTIINGLTHKDVFLAQRAIKKRKNRKDILKKGQNVFKVLIKDKDGNIVNDVKINMLITMTTTHSYDKKLDFKNTNIETFNLDKIGFWNITGSIKIGDIEGSFFIKTNAK